MITIWRLPRPYLLHLTTGDLWAEAQRTRLLRSASLDDEGFIHLSTTWQAPATAERYYAGRTDLVVLAIDPGGLTPSVLRWEESRPGEFFPHHFGPIPAAAVAQALPWPAPPTSGDGAPWPLPDGLLPPPVTRPLPAGADLVRLGGAGRDLDADVAAVVDVVARATIHRSGAVTDGTLERAAGRLRTPGGWGIGVVDAEGDLLSLVLGVPMLDDLGAGPPVPGWCHLGTVMTRPSAWGLGLATRLMVEAVVVMRAGGSHHAELYTQAENRRAQDVYTRLDWQRSDRPILVDDGDELAHFTLALRP